MNTAIDRLMASSRAESLELVGFSGGGSVSALVAARRHDVINIRTVAANLDTAFWTVRERLSPLTGSLNPADFANQLQNIPQRHFSGANDTVVDITILRSFEAHFKQLDCVATEVVPGAGHGDGWRERWAALLSQPVECTRQ